METNLHTETHNIQQQNAIAPYHPSQMPNHPVKQPVRKHKLGVLLFFLILGIVVSVVDITFLSDVLGRLLDLNDEWAITMSAVIGLAAMILLMGFHGYIVAHSGPKPWYKNFEIILWFVLGVALLILRIISANFIEVNESEGIIQLLGMKIRAIDFVIGPIMFIFYLGAGFLAKYCVENIFNSDGWDEFWAKAREKKKEREELKKEALKKQREIREEQAGMKAQAGKNIANNKDIDAKKKKYYDAVQRYKQLEKGVHEQYDKISDSLTNLENKQDELSQTEEARQRLLNNIEKSRNGLQNEVALLIHAKHPENSVDTLKDIIKRHNNEQTNAQ